VSAPNEFLPTGAGEKVSLGFETFSASNPISPVPEPESYAMLLAGLGLMGTIALRRKNSDVS
jgi:hypothetical protein